MTKEFSIAIIMIAAAFGPGLAIGWIASSAMNAIGRNPESAGKITGSLLLSLGLAEAIAIYCLVVSLVLKFVA